MPSWLLGEEEEEEEQVKAGGFFPAFPQRLKSVGGLASLSRSHGTSLSVGAAVLLFVVAGRMRRLEVGGGGQLLQMSGPVVSGVTAR